jgi:isocitrate/isopropylmalate dehydrogenase
MAEAPHGTAPSLERKNVANPMAMILAAAALLDHMHSTACEIVAKAIQQATFGAVYDGIRTSDLGGHATTSEFADEVIRRVRAKLQ